MKDGKEKKNLIRKCAGTVAFCLVLLLVLGRVYQVLSWKDTAGGYITSTETFYGLERDLVDVVFLGSSHCYCSVINSQLWEDYGIAGYSLSISGQDMAASYYWLKEALKTQKPEVVCLEMYYALFHGYGVEGNLYRNILSHHISPDYLSLVRALTDEESGSAQTEKKMVSEEDRGSFLTKWPIIHTRYKELQRQDFTGPDVLYIGYTAENGERCQSISRTRDGAPLYTGDETLEIEEEIWLRRIIELTRENGIELCLFLSPMSVTTWEQKQYNYVAELAAEEGIPFLNFVDLWEEIKIDSEQDFLDGGHVNYRGAEKVTAALGKYMAENYDLEDHRGDKRYELWERDAAVREHEFQNMRLQQSTDMDFILYAMTYFTDYTVIMTTNGDYFRETDYLADRLEPLRIGDDFWGGGGSWIIENEEVTWKTTDRTGDWYMDRNGADIVVIREEGSSRVFVDQQEYAGVQDGVNFVFYDNLLGKVVCVAGFSAPDNYTVVR